MDHESHAAGYEGPCLGGFLVRWGLYAFGMVMLWQWLSPVGWPAAAIWAVAIAIGLCMWLCAREL